MTVYSYFTDISGSFTDFITRFRNFLAYILNLRNLMKVQLPSSIVRSSSLMAKRGPVSNGIACNVRTPLTNLGFVNSSQGVTPSFTRTHSDHRSGCNKRIVCLATTKSQGNMGACGRYDDSNHLNSTLCQLCLPTAWRELHENIFLAPCALISGAGRERIHCNQPSSFQEYGASPRVNRPTNAPKVPLVSNARTYATSRAVRLTSARRHA